MTSETNGATEPTTKRRGCPPGGWPKTGKRKTKRARKAPKSDPVTFHCDDVGAVTILHGDGTGVELTPDEAVRLASFLDRVLLKHVSDETGHT